MDFIAGLGIILVKQKVEILEVITGFETNNRYEICQPNGQPFARALEETDCCSRFFCGKQRPFSMDIVDFNGTALAHIDRQYTYNCYQCCSCMKACQDVVSVECPPGNLIGYVRQEFDCCNINFRVEYPDGQPMLYLRGPGYCLCTCPGTVHTFRVMSVDLSQQIGQLTKRWSGFIKELFTDADNFAVEVPPDMAVSAKILLIAAALLIDFMFFEDNKKRGKKGLLGLV